MAPTRRLPGELVFALAFIIFAICSLVLLPLQTKWVPDAPLPAQPAFWPGIGVLMMVGFGAIHLLQTARKDQTEGRREEVLFWLRSLEFVAWFLAYVSLVPIVGYLPCTLVFNIALAYRLGYRRPQSIVAAALFGFAVVAIFKAGLQVKVPAGALYDYLPAPIRTFMMVNF